jgi:hypothetical protein
MRISDSLRTLWKRLKESYTDSGVVAFIGQLRIEIAFNKNIQNGAAIERMLENKTRNIIGHWLGEEWYVKDLERRAAGRLLWAGADAEDRRRRLYIANQLWRKSSARDRFNSLYEQVIIAGQRQGLGETLDAECREVGMQLCNLTKEITGQEGTDLMQLFHLMVDAIDVDVARTLESRWNGICGWTP